MERLKNNLYDVSISEKRKLDDSLSYYLVDYEYLKSKNMEKPIQLTGNNGFTIKIGPKKAPTSSSVIILLKGDSFVGHISSNIYEDNTAEMIMSGVRNIPLPSYLEKYRNNMINPDVAFLVSEEYRGTGKDRKLIMLMLEHLLSKGVNKLKVCGITGPRAARSYEKSGAELIPDTNKAVYRDIRKIVEAEKLREQRQSPDAHGDR